MFPQGVSFIGGDWLCVVREMNKVFGLQTQQLFEAFLNRLPSEAQLSRMSFKDMKERLTYLLKDTPLILEDASINITTIVRALYFSKLNQCDMALILLFHILSMMCGEILEKYLPCDWRILWNFSNPKSLFDRGKITTQDVVQNMNCATSLYSNLLYARKFSDGGLSPRYLSFNLSRLAYRFMVNCVVNNQPSDFGSAFKFLAVLEAPDNDTLSCCTMYFNNTVFSSLRSLHTAAKSTNMSKTDQLLKDLLVELRNLRRLCYTIHKLRIPPPTYGLQDDNLAVLIFMLFDRLSTLTLVEAGVTSETHPSLWHTLYGDCYVSVESWAQYLLSVQITEE